MKKLRLASMMICLVSAVAFGLMDTDSDGTLIFFAAFLVLLGGIDDAKD